MASVSPQPREVKNPSLVQKFGFGTPNGLTAGGMGTEASSVLGANFPGISFTGWIPADPQIAVSATHIVQVVNTKIAFFNKSGVKSFERELGSSGFFTGIATTATFDPKVFYDKFTDRFVVVTLEQDGTNSQFCIAVSDTGNPNGNWKKYKLDNKGTVGSNTFWLDYEGWGHNKDAVVATGNMFPFGSGNVYVQAFVIKKSELYGGTGFSATKFDDNGTFTIQVAKMDDNSVNYVYGSSLESNSSLRVYAWSNLTTTPTMQFTVVNVPSFNFIGRPPSAGGAVLDSLSGRLVDATYRTGSLLTCHTTAAETGSSRSQCTWYEFKPNAWPASGNVTLAQAGNVALPGDAWAFIPGINKNKFGDISILFTRSSTSIAADLLVTSHKASDPKGQMSAPTQLGTSQAPYKLSGRWGDYISVCVDPQNDFTFWGNHMKSNSSGNWVAEIVSWNVTTDTGGGVGGTTINANGVSTLEGTFVSGDLNSIKTADTSNYITTAVKKADGGFATASQSTFTLPMSANTLQSLVVSERISNSTGKSLSGFVFVWNWLTNRWDSIKTGVFGSANTDIQFSITNFASYVNSSKQVKIMVRGLDPIRTNGAAPSVFNLKVDLSRLNAIPKG